MKIRYVLIALATSETFFRPGLCPDPLRELTMPPYSADNSKSLPISYPINAYSVSALEVSVSANFWTVVEPLQTNIDIYTVH